MPCLDDTRLRVTRRQGFGLLPGLIFCCHAVLCGCRKADPLLADVVVEYDISPQPVKVGSATIILRLSDPGGAPWKGAQVSLEANMSHPGMAPVLSEAREITEGRFEAPLNFTMAGDWIVLIHAILPDGRRLERPIEIKGVRSAG